MTKESNIETFFFIVVDYFLTLFASSQLSKLTLEEADNPIQNEVSSEMSDQLNAPFTKE